MTDRVCKSCGSPNLDIRPRIFSNGTKHVELICIACRSHNGYLGQGMDEERMETFEMPLGKYKGKLIKDIVKEDRSYSEWAARTISRKRINSVFKHFLNESGELK